MKTTTLFTPLVLLLLGWPSVRAADTNVTIYAGYSTNTVLTEAECLALPVQLVKFTRVSTVYLSSVAATNFVFIAIDYNFGLGSDLADPQEAGFVSGGNAVDMYDWHGDPESEFLNGYAYRVVTILGRPFRLLRLQGATLGPVRIYLR